MANTLKHLAELLPTKGDLVEIVKGGISLRQPSEEPFRIKSGTSWVYCDEKLAACSGSDLWKVGHFAVAEIRRAGIVFSAVGGLTMGASHVTSAIGMTADCRMFEVCKPGESYDRYDQGNPQRIVGTRFISGDRLLVAEDVTSTGGSALQAIGIIRNVCAEQEVEDVEVVGAVTMLDRGRVAAERFASAGISFVALTNYADVGIEPVV